jgi:hypothetical protein
MRNGNDRMKKLLFLGFLSLAALAADAANARAWFDCCCRHHCCKYSTVLCIRPYNAFSPVAYGNIIADGCMPVNVYGGQLPCTPSCFNGGGGCAGPGCCTSGCCDFGCLPPAGAIGQPLPQGNPGPQFTPPNPTPLNPGTSTVAPNLMGYTYGYSYAPVQTVGYYPYAQPVAPMNYYQPQGPAYWYGR